MARTTRPNADDADAQRDAAVEEQPIDAAAAHSEIVNAPYGGAGRGPRAQRAQTFVRGANRGWHLNLHLATAELEMASQWPNGTQVRWQCSGGVPEIVRLRAAEVKGYMLLKYQQRPYFSIPTKSVGRAAPSHEPVAAESWVEGDEILIRIPPGFFTSGGS